MLIICLFRSILMTAIDIAIDISQLEYYISGMKSRLRKRKFYQQKS